MKGRTSFTRQDADKIRILLKKCRAERDQDKQKGMRADIRKIGFYISDFRRSNIGFTLGDFDILVKLGKVKIID